MRLRVVSSRCGLRLAQGAVLFWFTRRHEATKKVKGKIFFVPSCKKIFSYTLHQKSKSAVLQLPPPAIMAQ